MNQLALIDDVAPTARRDHDFYETPSWMVSAMLRRIPISGPVLEPCAGRLAISRVLQASGLTVTSNEPYQDVEGLSSRLDATKPERWAKWRRFDWVVTNPPFNLANQIVPLALSHARLGVAMVLRLSWFEPTADRAALLHRHPPALINMPRCDFRGNGQTDSVTAAWFVWTVREGSARYGRFQNDVVTPAERDELIAAERLEQAHA